MKYFFSIAVNICFAEISDNKLFDIYGGRTVAEILRKVQTVTRTGYFGALNKDTLTKEEKSKSLRAVNII